MKKLITTFFCFLVLGPVIAQIQFKIADPSIASGLDELKKAAFYNQQLKQLGFTDKDVQIKTFPLRKYYSELAGNVTKSLVEADRAEFWVEIQTKKNAKGMNYKMEGYVVFNRSNVAADKYGSYNASFTNNWKVFHLNMSDFLPANQKHLVDPLVVKKMLMNGLSNGSVKASFMSTASDGFFYDIIELKDIMYVTEEMANKGDGYKTEIVNVNEQRYGFIWSAIIAKFSPDTSYIFEIVKKDNISSEVTIKIENGEPRISNCFFANSGMDTPIFSQDTRGNIAYDTLFGGLTWVGTQAIMNKRKPLNTTIFQGKKVESFAESFANSLLQLSNEASLEQVKQTLSKYVTKDVLDAWSESIHKALQNGFKSKLMEHNTESYIIDWEAKTKSAKKSGDVPPKLILKLNGPLIHFRNEGGIMKLTVKHWNY